MVEVVVVGIVAVVVDEVGIQGMVVMVAGVRMEMVVVVGAVTQRQGARSRVQAK